MSIFGSREDDPLLQGDPRAPTPKDESTDEGEGAERERTENQVMRSDDRDRDEPNAPASSGASRSSEETVFASSGDGPSRSRTEKSSSSGTTDTRILVRSVEEAAAGSLSRLNAAIEAGWRLQRVELRDGPPDSDADRGGEQSLAFVLRRAGF
jgi:hypothetical protein